MQLVVDVRAIDQAERLLAQAPSPEPMCALTALVGRFPADSEVKLRIFVLMKMVKLGGELFCRSAFAKSR